MARRFDVDTATLTRWLRQLEPQTKRKCCCPKLREEVLLAEVERYPDAYHFEQAACLGVSASGTAKALRRYGLTCKKRRSESHETIRFSNHATILFGGAAPYCVF